MTELDAGSLVDDVLADLSTTPISQQSESVPQTVDQTPGENAPANAPDSTNKPTTSEAGVSALPDTPEQLQQVTNDDFQLVVDNLLDTMVDLTELKSALISLIYGDPKTGKTVMACAHTEMVLFVNIENGAISLKNHPELVFNKDGTQRIRVMDFKSYKQLMALAEALRRGYLSEYKVIVLDTFSSLYKYDLDLVVSANVKAFNDKSETQLDRDMYIPQGDKDYQPVIQRMSRLAQAFADSGRDIVFVCHQKEEKIRGGGISQIRPDLSPTLAKQMYKLASVIGWQFANTDNTGTHRFLQVQPDTTVVAGTRVGGLPSIIPNPTLHTLMTAHHKLNEELKLKGN